MDFVLFHTTLDQQEYGFGDFEGGHSPAITEKQGHRALGRRSADVQSGFSVALTRDLHSGMVSWQLIGLSLGLR